MCLKLGGVWQACAAADQLKGNLDSEFVAVRDFIAAFCRCMDYVQHARMLVVGYPFTPDVLAITNLVRGLATWKYRVMVYQMCAASWAVASLMRRLACLKFKMSENGGVFVMGRCL